MWLTVTWLTKPGSRWPDIKKKYCSIANKKREENSWSTRLSLVKLRNLLLDIPVWKPESVCISTIRTQTNYVSTPHTSCPPLILFLFLKDGQLSHDEIMERLDELKISTITDYGLLIVGEHDELWDVHLELDMTWCHHFWKKWAGTWSLVKIRTELFIYLKKKVWIVVHNWVIFVIKMHSNKQLNKQKQQNNSTYFIIQIGTVYDTQRMFTLTPLYLRFSRLHDRTGLFGLEIHSWPCKACSSLRKGPQSNQMYWMY